MYNFHGQSLIFPCEFFFFFSSNRKRLVYEFYLNGKNHFLLDSCNIFSNLKRKKTPTKTNRNLYNLFSTLPYVCNSRKSCHNKFSPEQALWSFMMWKALWEIWYSWEFSYCHSCWQTRYLSERKKPNKPTPTPPQMNSQQKKKVDFYEGKR